MEELTILTMHSYCLVSYMCAQILKRNVEDDTTDAEVMNSLAVTMGDFKVS